uniref:Addiction module antitoxin, RelB/DinJ family n=1 Tax=uncultured bacterium Contig19 TaxID=1393523 RepID=W0FKH8_9BACT|nr:hypothetical protein [uncultured bacterium Contig19]
MATAQLNVRIDEDLKAAGDAVLERYNVPAVQLIRDVWRYMADHQRIPHLGEKPSDAEQVDDSIFRNQIESQAGMALRLAREAGLRAELENMTYDQLRESAYEEMLQEMAERRV